jgi:hypothetical protein
MTILDVGMRFRMPFGGVRRADSNIQKRPFVVQANIGHRLNQGFSYLMI